MSERAQHVFFDPTGRRRRVINRATLGLGIASGLVAAAFIVSLLAAPFVQAPGITAQAATFRARTPGSLIAPRRARISRHLVQQARAELAREIAATQRSTAVQAAQQRGDTIVAAFYVVWQGMNGLNDLLLNAEHLTHVIPEWLHLARDGASLDLRDFDTVVVRGNAKVIRLANQFNLDLIPILNNAESRVFDPDRAALMLGSPQRRRQVAIAVRDFLVHNGFDGVNVDFENLTDKDYTRLPAFLSELKAVLPESLSVSVDIEARLPVPVVQRLARAADFVVVMAYAQNGPSQDPGPLASLPWFDSTLTRLGAVIPEGKLVVGVGSYGVDWQRGGPAGPVSVTDAWAVAQSRRPGERPDSVVDFDDIALNPTYVYRDDSAKTHEVWFLDAATAFNELTFARRHGAAGTALWVLGEEDPSLWSLYDRRLKGVMPGAAILDSIAEPLNVHYTGDGELLSLVGLPKAGKRHVDIDSATGLVTDESYETYPEPFTVRREGYHPGMLALTFDDGPDKEYTDEIVDTLAALGVPGTFFLIGQNVEKYPQVVRRIMANGNEIGNHTFTHPNMGEKTHRRSVLELNAAQRAIESVTGRSTTLFRVPYNTDAEPQFANEAKTLGIATELGYITVGELLDPSDWNIYTQDADGRQRLRTTQELAADIIQQVHTIKGNVILLHSAGGDRSRTVRCLSIIVPQLEAQGYRFVEISTLLGVKRDAVMPPVTARDQVLVGLDRVSFEILDVGESVLTYGFLAALSLAVLRVLFIVPLALIARRNGKRHPPPPYAPPVSVLIAAYNEATVIERTIKSILASDYEGLEVIVVDDGSSDETASVVRTAFGADTRVRLFSQPNAGKAGALNRAIAEAKHEILVGFDADTVTEPDTIRLLARHFADPEVAAVAGNVKVGNRINTLTIWQSIEYITSQNLDRRGYTALNAVTVVPGAVGAWRREAILQVGGHLYDTLAEDMDLTFRLRRAGFIVTSESDAVAWTEAPETFGPFLRQRYRWAFGSLQVLWKHRGALGRFGWFGRLVLPAQWLFGVIFQILGPLVDLRLLYAFVAVLISAVGADAQLDWQPQLARLLAQTGFFYAVYFAVDLAASFVAFVLDGEDMKQLWWLFWQRFIYRQTMYYVLWKAVVGAIKGKRFGWGKLQRTGSVQMAETRG